MPIYDLISGQPTFIPGLPGSLRVTTPNVPAGRSFYVDSVNGSDGFTGSSDRPFRTLTAALNSVVSGRDDAIYLKPGFTATISAAAAILVSKSRVSIIGMGTGTARPTFTFDTLTTASLRITGNNVTMRNIIGVCNIDLLAGPFDVRGTDCALGIPGSVNPEMQMEWEDDTVTPKEALRMILGASGADRMLANIVYRGNINSTRNVNAIRLVNTNGARIEVDFYGKCSTAVVEFVTTASQNIQIAGTTFVSGTTNGGKNVIDTVTGSIWAVDLFDVAAGLRYTGSSGLAPTLGSPIGAGSLNVPATDAITNTLERDVVGSKADASQQPLTATRSLVGYIKGLLDALLGAGITTYPAAAAPANAVSLAAVARESYDQSEKVAVKPAAVISTGLTLFTITGGPIEIVDLVSLCVTANDATASTLQYRSNPTTGLATTISGASASLANALAGDGVALNGTLLTTPPDVSSPLVALGPVKTRNIIVPAGTLQAVVGVGSTVGTWSHHLRYRPLARGVTVA